ncbi:FHA domain-containing protein [Mariniblastus fucicola]|uniref:FHA domain protein n=1 Tax=Mariniblastus fucicola TaxID=980251 RepID=A0A5B9PBX5_9BACT|nr:FHA domain-containing protein [Mariniblastus fucicola]QEG20663.1 FHA domain protein [Mariniblastus fucicola]
MNQQGNTPPPFPYLSVKSRGETIWFSLDSSSNALIGSGGHCKVQLDGEGVRSLHCILEIKDDGRLEVRDWNTGCTFVNGQAINEPTELRERDLMKIGQHEITAVLSQEGAQAALAPEPEAEVEVKTEPVAEPQIVAQSEPQGQPEVFEPPQAELPTETSEAVEPADPVSFEPPVANGAEPELSGEPLLTEEEAQAPSENAIGPVPVEWVDANATPTVPTVSVEPEVPAEPVFDEPAPVEPVAEVPSEPASAITEDNLTPPVEASEESSPVAASETDVAAPENTSIDFVYDIDADFEDETGDVPYGFAAPEFNDEFVSADEVRALRMENEQLRFELAKRSTSPSSQDAEVLSREQTVKLVSRLEELLQELKRSDVRARDMEELLRSADQATQDEQEERKQIEKWVSELESRVTQRESETEAEVQQLRKLLDEARASQQESNAALQRVIDAKTSEGETVPVAVVEDLRNQIGSLQTQLNSAQADAASLREQQNRPSAGSLTEAEQQQSERKLAEMQLETSRERAEISRQRVELKRLKADLEERLGEPREANVADTRIRAMREHLKELHDKEEQEKANRRESGGLANRIASLLHRVTGE